MNEEKRTLMKLLVWEGKLTTGGRGIKGNNKIVPQRLNPKRVYKKHQRKIQKATRNTRRYKEMLGSRLIQHTQQKHKGQIRVRWRQSEIIRVGKQTKTDVRTCKGKLYQNKQEVTKPTP